MTDSQHKLVDYIQDILEALDTLPASLSASHPFFARLAWGPAGQPCLKSDALRRLDSLLTGVRMWPAALVESDGDQLVSLLRAGAENEDDEEVVDEKLDVTSPFKGSPRKKAADEMEVEETLVVSSGFSSPSYGGFDSTPPRPPPKEAIATSSKGKERAPRPEPVERELERGLGAGILWKLMALPGVPKLVRLRLQPSDRRLPHDADDQEPPSASTSPRSSSPPSHPASPNCLRRASSRHYNFQPPHPICRRWPGRRASSSPRSPASSTPARLTSSCPRTPSSGSFHSLSDPSSLRAVSWMRLAPAAKARASGGRPTRQRERKA